MPFPTWGIALQSTLAGMGIDGPDVSRLTDAVGIGSNESLVGKPFTTMDVGLTPGAGVGAGIGIIGVAPAQIANQIFSEAVASFGQAGAKLMDICQAMGSTAVMQIALAILVSVDTPVYLGAGTIIPGTIGVVGPAWGQAIFAVGSGQGLEGSQWMNYAKAIGDGHALPIASQGTGTLVISGPGVPLPVPGVGTGVGTIL